MFAERFVCIQNILIKFFLKKNNFHTQWTECGHKSELNISRVGDRVDHSGILNIFYGWTICFWYSLTVKVFRIKISPELFFQYIKVSYALVQGGKYQ